MDADTSKELEAAEVEEENAMEHNKFCTNCETTKTPLIFSKVPAAAVEEEDQAAAVERKKFCTDCKTTKTPLWRVGPSGPKSLCNACGIRYRKKKTPASNSGTQSRVHEKLSNCLSNSVKMSLVILGKDWLVETTSVGKKRRRQRKRKLREEEIAAASLVALSCGTVFA